MVEHRGRVGVGVATDLQRTGETKLRPPQVYACRKPAAAVSLSVPVDITAAAAEGVHQQQRRIGFDDSPQHGGDGARRTVAEAAAQQEQVEGGGEGVPAAFWVDPPDENTTSL